MKKTDKFNCLDEINESLDKLNDIKSTYEFVEWQEDVSDEHVNMTLENIMEIIFACNDVITNIRKKLEK
jgi:hypothetical protein